jgi:hypothetical protein
MGTTKLAQILVLLEPAKLARLDALAKSTKRPRMMLLREAIALLFAKHGSAPPKKPAPPLPSDIAAAQVIGAREALERAMFEGKAPAPQAWAVHIESVMAKYDAYEQALKQQRLARASKPPPFEKPLTRHQRGRRTSSRGVSELQPDKLGREQTAAERKEVTRLMNRRPKK